MEQRLFNVDIKIAPNLATSNTSVTTWDSMTLTPQYSDSILEVRFSGSLSSNNDSSNSGNFGPLLIFLNIIYS